MLIQRFQLVGLTLLAAIPCTAAALRADEKPDIVVIVADDLGYADVSFNGGEILTPAIDRIAREGVNLTRFYACPVCSPTRAGLMTGRWPHRMGMMRAVIPPWRKWGLPPSENTLAEMLAGAGYPRRAVVGKWHLGHSAKKYHPLEQGFTQFYGHYNGAIDYWTHDREGQVDWHRGWETVKEEGYSTDLLGSEAARVVRETPAGEPLLLYVPFNAPHSPLQAHEKDVERFSEMFPKKRAIHAAMVVAMDRAVGKILDALDATGRAENTFVLFFSDNGGTAVGDNGPLRGRKASAYEGGTRVCAAARWPAGGIAGGKKVSGLMGYIDVYPTLKRIAGAADTPDPNPLDGVDVLDVMRGNTDQPKRDWYSYIHQDPKHPRIAVIAPPYKLVVNDVDVAKAKSLDPSQAELFDLEKDPNEKNNLLAAERPRAERLYKKLRTFLTWRVPGTEAYGEGRAEFEAPKDWVIPE